MPAARSIFVHTTPSHLALIRRTKSLTPQSFRTFVSSTDSFLTIQEVASNDAHIKAPPPQFLDAHFCRRLLK